MLKCIVGSLAILTISALIKISDIREMYRLRSTIEYLNESTDVVKNRELELEYNRIKDRLTRAEEDIRMYKAEQLILGNELDMCNEELKEAKISSLGHIIDEQFYNEERRFLYTK